MPINVLKNTLNSLNSLKKALFGQKISIPFPFSKFNKLGNAAGKLIGGDLSILYGLQRSIVTINTESIILFFEDLDEYLYHVDHMIVALKRIGVFENLKGLIVGGLTQMHDNTVPFGKTAKEIIIENLKEYQFPICFDFPAGHIDDNLALILGSEVELNIDKNGTTVSFLPK